MKLVLHIGTHKTGTTAIQRFLGANQAILLNKGIWYPKYSELLEGKSNHYAHIDIPKGLMGQSKVLSASDCKNFLSGLKKKADEYNCHTVVISAESFIRGTLGNSNRKWIGIEAFIKEVRNCISIDDVEVVITFRNLMSFLPSLYNEHIKVTNYQESVVNFHSQFRERFNYPLIASTWQKHFPKVKCLHYEKLGKGPDFIKNWLFDVLDLSDTSELNFSDSPRNVSWPLDFVALKREMNGFLNAQERNNLRALITSYLASEKYVALKDHNQSWLTTEQMKAIIASHEKLYRRDMVNFGLDAEELLQFNSTEHLFFDGNVKRPYMELLRFSLNK